MQNFNTNQTRFLYVATSASSVDNPLGIVLAQTQTGEAYFKYKNVEGMLTRTDTFDPKKIKCLKLTQAAAMATPLQAIKITQNSDDVALSTLSGKAVDLVVTINDAIDYDSRSSFVVSFVGNATNTANAAAFYNALAKEIVKAMPKGDGYPKFDVYVAKSSSATKVTATSSALASANCVVLAQLPQKYVRGKLSGEPCPVNVTFQGDIPGWGKTDAAIKTVADINTALSVSLSPATISGTYKLADLEFFAAGEKGDYYRGFNYPNDYEFVPAIDLTKSYDVVSIEYFWQGNVENVQKSPRLIQIAVPTTSSGVASAIYNAVYALTPDSLVDRVEALEGSSN